MSKARLAYQIPKACKVSGLSRTALYLLFKQRVIIPRKHGHRTIVLAKDLERYLEGLPAAEQLSPPPHLNRRKPAAALSAA
jgi:hypothetical protein